MENRQPKLIIQRYGVHGYRQDPIASLTKTFQPKTLSPADIFVRENVQNAYDLRSDPGKRYIDVDINFTEIHLSSDHFSLMTKLFDPESMEKLKSQMESNGKSSLNELESGSTIRCTQISDHVGKVSGSNKGMWGSMEDTKSVFYYYMSSEGYSDKSVGAVGGHGIGKLSNHHVSKDHLFILYTYTNEKVAGSPGTHKCIAHGIGRHEGDNTGRWYLCGESRKYPKQPSELVGDQAKQMCAAFGIEPRSGTDYGTTICVFNSTVSLKEVRDSYHFNFFPAHFEVDRPPVVVFKNQKEKEEEFVDYDQYNEITHFIEAYEVASNKKTNSQHSEYVPLIGKGKKHTGSLGAMAYSRHKMDYADPDKELKLVRPREYSIARIRGYMVINYWKPRRRPGGLIPSEKFAGIYVCSDADINTTLGLSEPPLHQDWEDTAVKLEDSSEKKKLVRDVLNAIDTEYKRYYKSMQPKPKSDSEVSAEFARLAAKYSPPIGGKGEGKNGVKKIPSIFHESKQTQLSVTDQSNGNVVIIDSVYEIENRLNKENFDTKQRKFPLDVKVQYKVTIEGSDMNVPVTLLEDENGFVDRAVETITFKKIDDVRTSKIKVSSPATNINISCVRELI
jgi:hypothetical protein